MSAEAHHRVSPRYWTGKRRAWNDREKLLGAYLMTCEHRTTEGLYRLPKGYISSDLTWTTRQVDEALERIVADGFAMYDADAEVVLLPKALKRQRPTTANQIAGAVRRLHMVPTNALWDAFLAACDRYAPSLADAIRMDAELHPNGHGNTHANTHGNGHDDAPADAHANASRTRARTFSSSSSSSMEEEGDAPAIGLHLQLDDALAALRAAPGLEVEPLAVNAAMMSRSDVDVMTGVGMVAAWAHEGGLRVTSASRLLFTALAKLAEQAARQDGVRSASAASEGRRGSRGRGGGATAADFLAIANEDEAA